MPAPSQYSHNLEVGEDFEQKYEIVRELGSGGFGKVYLAYQQAMDRHVALKVLKGNLDQERAEQAKERFLREVKVISRLRHPHTVTIHDFGESDRHALLYMVLEFVDGEPLNDILEKEGAQQPARALTLTTQIARSLSEAHNHGVVHRDLKPANIMVTELEGEGDFVKVLDFGIARLLAQSDRDLTRASLDEDGEKIIGTPRYMSPEQVRGNNVDAKSDVYCLGLLLYEMLVGEPAVRGETTMALITQQVSPDPLELPHINAFPDSVARILRRATAKTTQDRYPSADDLIEDLQLALRHDYAGDSSGRVARAGSSSSGPLAAHDSTPNPNQSQHPTPDHVTTDDWQQGNQPQGQPLPEGEANERRDDEGGVFEPDDLEDTGDRFAGAPAPALDQDPFDVSKEPPEQREPPSDEPEQRVPQERPQTSPPTGTQDASVGWLGASLAALLAVVGLYASFATVGALLGEFLDGSTRLMATLVVAALLPLFGTLIGSPPDQLRFDKKAPASDAWTRRFASIGIICVAAALLVCVAVPDRVLPRLKSEPNWFLPTTNSSQMGQANQTVSRTLAIGIQQPLEAFGLYDPPPLKPDRSYPSPADSRHAVGQKKTKEKTSDDKSKSNDSSDSFGSDPDDQNQGQYEEW